MAWIAEHAKHFCFEIVGFVAGIAVIDPGKFHSHARLLIEVFSGPPGEDGRDESFEGDALLVDDRLRLVDNFLFCFYERQIEIRLRDDIRNTRSEEHTSELQSLRHLVCRLLLEKKK